jgi:hypothetical protein
MLPPHDDATCYIRLCVQWGPTGRGLHVHTFVAQVLYTIVHALWLHTKCQTQTLRAWHAAAASTRCVMRMELLADPSVWHAHKNAVFWQAAGMCSFQQLPGAV